MELNEAILELLRRASTDLSADVQQSLQVARDGEGDGTPARAVFDTILENVEMARKQSTPMCQDTGSPAFFIDYPEGGIERTYRESIEWAAAEATNRQYLRPNAVDPVSGKNSGNNVGINAPYVHFHQWPKDETRVRLLLKGGGSENVGTQYKLPHAPIHAGRDLEGVRRVIIDAVKNAQGLGCAPGVIAVGLGGTRDISYALAKEQLFRKMGTRSEQPELAELELRLLKELNQLEIGPMGFGGNTTVLDVFIGTQHRHPATFYVSMTYNCWAFRRKEMIIKNGEVQYD